MGVGEGRIERNGLFEKRLDLLKVEIGILGTLSFPQAHCVVVVCASVGGLKFGKTAESLDHFVGLARGAVIAPGQKKITAWVGRAEICSTEKKFDGIIVVAARVEGHAKTDQQAGRAGIALDGLLEDLDGRLESAMKEELAAPIEEIAFAGIHVGGGFEFVGGS